jgi:hypothetical protein
MAVRKFSSEELIRMDLASTEVALFEVNVNYEHYREEKNRLEQKKMKLQAELRRLKKAVKA